MGHGKGKSATYSEPLLPTVGFFEENFNSYNDGPLNSQGEWIGSDAFLVQGDLVYEGLKALKVIITGAQTILKTCSQITEGTISIRMRRDINAGGLQARQKLIIHSVDELALCDIFLANSNIQYRVNETYVILKPSFNLGQWYNLQVQFRSVPDEKVRYRVDFEPWTDWITRAQAASTGPAYHVDLLTSQISGGAVAYFDYITK